MRIQYGILRIAFYVIDIIEPFFIEQHSCKLNIMFKQRKKEIILFIILLIPGYSSHIYAENNAADKPEVSKPKTTKINWKDIKGAVKYNVQIKDKSGKIIVQEIVDSSSIVLTIPYGRYSIRIGAINRFNNVGSWSNWRGLNIVKPRKPVEKISKAHPDMIFWFGIGISYFHVLPDWDMKYSNSLESAILRLGYCPFRSLPLLEYTGLEIEGTYVNLFSHERQSVDKSKISDIFSGGNILIKTRFDFPLNFTARGGCGIVFSKLKKYNNTEPNTVKSQDLYYKAGLSVEYRFSRHFYLESGADFNVINYISKNFRSIKYFCLIGTGI